MAMYYDAAPVTCHGITGATLKITGTGGGRLNIVDEKTVDVYQQLEKK